MPSPTPVARARTLAGNVLRRRRGVTGFVTDAPSARAVVELFAGEWASRLPPPYADLPAGSADLFDDARIRWALEQLGGVDGADLLELGPLEGGHTHMLLEAGAASVTAVEANAGAWVRCLAVKELLGMDRAHFLLGDFVEHLEAADRHHDVGFAVGVLYHLPDPVQTLALLARRVDRLVLWTHYWDAEIVAAHPTLSKRIKTSETAERAGFRHTLHRHEYGLATRGAAFWGGNRGFAGWLSRDDLLGAVEALGWTGVEIAFDERDHPNGPALALVASR